MRLWGFWGANLGTVPDHYREADPMQLKISQATQWLIHGASDDTVPPFLSRNYTEQKKKRGENVHYLEISTAGHFDLIDPRSTAWPKVEGTVLHHAGVVGVVIVVGPWSLIVRSVG